MPDILLGTLKILYLKLKIKYRTFISALSPGIQVYMTSELKIWIFGYFSPCFKIPHFGYYKFTEAWLNPNLHGGSNCQTLAENFNISELWKLRPVHKLELFVVDELIKPTPFILNQKWSEIYFYLLEPIFTAAARCTMVQHVLISLEKTFFSSQGYTILIFVSNCCVYQCWKLESI